MFAGADEDGAEDGQRGGRHRPGGVPRTGQGVSGSVVCLVTGTQARANWGLLTLLTRYKAPQSTAAAYSPLENILSILR